MVFETMKRWAGHEDPEETPPLVLAERFKPFEKHGIKLIRENGKDYVDIFGVRLVRAENDSVPLVPPLEKYYNLKFTPNRMWLLQSIAIAIRLGQPVYIEGGTGIGKTYAFELICALCGYEFHKAPMSRGIEREDLMGYKDVNPERYTEADPEFIWLDRVVTECLRKEDGKIKLLLLDELNATDDNVMVGLHAVFDRVRSGGNYQLIENQGEIIEVDNEHTKIGAAANPPDGEHHGVDALQMATMRRWTYLKGPGRHSPEEEKKLLFSNFGLSLDETKDTQNDRSALVLQSRNDILRLSDIERLPGLTYLLDRVLEFHQYVVQAYETSQIGSGQSQPLVFESDSLFENIAQFVLRMYEDDLGSAIRNSLRYYYINRFEKSEDREKLEEQIRLIAYKPDGLPSKRIPLEGSKIVSSKKPAQKKKQIVTPKKKKKDVQPVPKINKEEVEIRDLVSDLEQIGGALAQELDDIYIRIENYGHDEQLVSRVEKIDQERKGVLTKGLESRKYRSKFKLSQKTSLRDIDSTLSSRITNLRTLISEKKPLSDDDFKF